MEFYVDCYECRNLIDNAKKGTPDLCGNKEALEYNQSLSSEKKVIPYTTDFNKNHDCKFVKLNFSGLVRKFFSN